MSRVIMKQDYSNNKEQVWEISIRRICCFGRKNIHWQRNVWL